MRVSVCHCIKFISYRQHVNNFTDHAEEEKKKRNDGEERDLNWRGCMIKSIFFLKCKI